MGNTVGSINVNKLISNPKKAYILGLFCADGYQRTSSIGLSNSDEDLLERFALFLRNYFSEERLKIRTYHPPEMKIIKISDKISSLTLTQNIVCYPSLKAKRISCHVYVNSRPLLRVFNLAKTKLEKIDKKAIASYMAGRFDGDGSVNKVKDRDFRIVYSNYKEAKIDQNLLRKIGIHKTSIYHYKHAGTFCLYVWRQEIKKITKLLIPFSVYLQKRKLTFFTP